MDPDIGNAEALGRQTMAFPNRAHTRTRAAYELLGDMRGLDPIAFPASHSFVCDGEKCPACEKIGVTHRVS
jgi:hypothetical protein